MDDIVHESRVRSHTFSDVTLPKMEGYLKKKHPKINGRWDKRYVQLYDNKLMTFMSKDKKKGLNHVSLSGLEVKITDPRHFEFIIGNTVDLWFIFRAHSREEMDEWVAAIGNSISLENKRDIKTITVHFLDSYKIPVAVNPHETTAEDVWWAVCETLDLAPEARTCFFIWVASDELELLLRGDDLIARIQEEWPLIENQFGVVNRSPCRFVFRTSISLNLATERKIKDTRAVHLFFIQSMFNVKRQNYVVSKEDAVHLAATEAQIRLGNYDKAKHQNYIIGNLAMYIPQYLIKAYSGEQWERLIAFEHQKLANKDKLILELLYLQRLRMKAYYGSTFVHAKIGQASIKDTGFFGQEATSGSTIVGLNMEGIHLVNPNNHRILRSFLWNQISNWQVTPDGKSFIFRAFNRDKNEYEVFNLHTVKAPIILDMILDIIYELKNQKAAIKEIRKSQSGLLSVGSSAIVSNAKPMAPPNNNNAPNKETHVINPTMNYGNSVNQPTNLVSNPHPQAHHNNAGPNMYPEDIKVKKSPREHAKKEKVPSRKSSSNSSGSNEKPRKASNWTANMYPFQSSENLHA